MLSKNSKVGANPKPIPQERTFWKQLYHSQIDQYNQYSWFDS